MTREEYISHVQFKLKDLYTIDIRRLASEDPSYEQLRLKGHLFYPLANPFCLYLIHFYIHSSL